MVSNDKITDTISVYFLFYLINKAQRTEQEKVE